jgi:hypothetical protein
MAKKTEEPAEFDLAAEEAEKKLVSLLDGLSPEEKKGALMVFQWHKNNYMQAGHKRLGRIQVKYSKLMAKK